MSKFRPHRNKKEKRQHVEQMEEFIVPDADGLLVDDLMRASRRETEAAKPWREKVSAALENLMHSLGIGQDEYRCEMEQLTSSLKDRIVFKDKDACRRAQEAVKDVLRITRTEFNEITDHKKNYTSPFKYAFVVVAENTAKIRTPESAYDAMVGALEQANRKLRLAA